MEKKTGRILVRSGPFFLDSPTYLVHLVTLYQHCLAEADRGGGEVFSGVLPARMQSVGTTTGPELATWLTAHYQHTYGWCLCCIAYRAALSVWWGMSWDGGPSTGEIAASRKEHVWDLIWSHEGSTNMGIRRFRLLW